MARVLIGWELGANRGHIVRCAELARHLVAAGHTVHAALQNIDGAPDHFPDGVTIWQSPVWPRMIVNVVQLRGNQAASMGDILFRLGLDRMETPLGLITAWDSLFRAIDPDVIVGDFAPSLTLAARGRVPVIALGTGFERIPGRLDSFPTLSGAARMFDERVALDNVNTALRRTDREPIVALPAIFATDHSLVSSFRELDPYGEWRLEPMVSPALGAAPPAIGTGEGTEIFVYGFEQSEPAEEVWRGLALCKLPVRIFVPRSTPTLRDKLVGLGFNVIDTPVPFDEIATRSRMVLSHSGHGFICSAMLAGLPQMLLPYDLEKKVHADAVVHAGLGLGTVLFGVRADALAATLRQIYHDDSLAKRVRDAAPRFHAQMNKPMAGEVLKIVGAMR